MHKGHGERSEILNNSKRVDNVLMCVCVCVCVCVQVKDSLERLRMEMKEALVNTGGKQQQSECQPC